MKNIYLVVVRKEKLLGVFILVITLVAGGIGQDQALRVAATTGSVSLGGSFVNSASNANTVQFGKLSVSGVAANAGSDCFVARVGDAGSAGSFVWAKAVGSSGADECVAVAASGTRLYATGTLAGTGSFDFLPLPSPYGTPLAFAAALINSYSLLPTTPAATGPDLRPYPNPVHAAATLASLHAGAPWSLLDLLGRPVATDLADATGTAQLAWPA